jgi:hypothetical protein
LREALEEQGLPVEQIGFSQWSLTINNGVCHPVSVRLGDDWLLLEAGSIPGDEPIGADALWDVLSRNAALPGYAKLTLTPGNVVALRAEVPLDDVDLGRLLGQTLDAFRLVWNEAEPIAAEGTQLSDAVLKRCCDDSGWPAVQRTSGRTTVALETSPVIQAILSPVGPGLLVSAELYDFGNCSALSRQAAGAFLLEASGLIRMARAAVTNQESTAVVRFEVAFRDAPCAAELSAAFSSLSTACALVNSELAALQIEDVARDYLATRAWTAGNGKQAKP